MTKQEKTEVAETEIIEEQNGLSVAFSPALIKANFTALEKQVEAKVKLYRDVQIDVEDPDQIKWAKKARADLNAIAKDLSARRIAIKNEYMNPYTEFEMKAKKIESIAKTESEKIGEQITEAEQQAKDKKRCQLQKAYEDFAPMLVPNVPYERIHEGKWLFKGTPIKKAEVELAEKVQKIASDWESLKQLELVFFDVCEVMFFETLDLGQAVSYNAKLVADRQKIDDMKQEMASIAQPEEALAEPMPIVQATPHTTPQPPVRPAPQRISDVAKEPPRPYIMIVDSATIDQIREAGRLLGSLGITGTFKAGTLDEVHAKGQRQAMQYAV